MNRRNRRLVILALAAVLGAAALWRTYDSPNDIPEVGQHPAPEHSAATRPFSGKAESSVHSRSTPSRADHSGAEGHDAKSEGWVEEALRQSDRNQEYGDRLRLEPVEQLAQRWPEMVRRDDPNELPVFLEVFAESLRKSGDARLYQQLAAMLNDLSTRIQDKAATLTLLGRTATPTAVEVLTHYLLNDLSKGGLDRTLREAISDAARTLIDGHWNWDVSPALESAWHRREANLPIADRLVLAQGIAYLSTADGARELLAATVCLDPLCTEDAGIATAALASFRRNEALPAFK